ncbi:MAG: hypothetical protein HY321_19090 [Armatimonadetes bacterium]|nr:hypothetical protein [Armatimonadota bacterium]
MLTANDANALIRKHSYLLEGLEARQQAIVAQLLENQEAYSRGLLEDTLTTDLAMPQVYAAALIRAAYPRLIANEICSIQPMRGPVGKVFYMDHAHEPFATYLTATAAAGTDTIEVNSAYGWKAGDTVAVGSGGTVENKVIDTITNKTVKLTTNLANNQVKNEPASVAYATSKTTEGGAVARAKLSLTSADISAQKYALGVVWSAEAAEDLRATHSLSAEQELIAAVAGEIAREIDAEILADMLSSATAGTVTYSQTKPAGWTETEWRHNLYEYIVQASNAVFGKRFREADFLVGDPDTIGLIERLEEFSLTTGGERAAAGTVRAGTLSNRWTVYKHAGFTADRILVGIRGDGYVYAPYVPLSLTPPVYDPGADRWVRNVRTRAGKKCTVGDAFAVVEITA